MFSLIIAGTPSSAALRRPCSQRAGDASAWVSAPSASSA
jgi:hypothetical protein